MDHWYKVFVSSTYLDLKDERRQIIEGLPEANCMPAGMELFPASPDEPLAVICNVIDTCDLYLLVIGGKYGSIARGGLSFTEMEFDYAAAQKMKIIAFVRTEDSIPTGPRYREKQGSDRAKKLARFRTKVMQSLITVKHWRSSDELKGLVTTSCNRVKYPDESGWIRARDIVPPCPYVERFVRSNEPPLLFEQAEQKIGGERAYRLLRYMFAHERFRRFRALDLALHRWEEATDDDGQILNVSTEILEKVELLLKSGRCRDFKRILVAEEREFKSSQARKILSMFRSREKRWRREFKGVEVETRVLYYPGSNAARRDKEIVEEIARLHDFALFIGASRRGNDAKGQLAIIETGLQRPQKPLPVESSEFRLTAETGKIRAMNHTFERLWLDSAKPISDVKTRHS